MAGDKIVLIGMMGAGKTTLGKMTAERTGRVFLDADSIIEAGSCMAIADIFRRFGEDEFRRRELATIRELMARPEAAVIATGGGAFCQPAVRDFLRGTGQTVFLKVSEAELLRRLERDGVEERPVLASPDWRARVLDLVRSRYPLYGEAAHILEIGDETPEQTVGRILDLLGVVA